MRPRFPFLFLFPVAVSAQTTLFFEDFESPAPAFTLNTTDQGSIAVGANTWLINNVYTGGNGDLICLGLPLPYSIVSTPGQPGGITSANGKYMHTASVEGITDGITCCSFAAPDLFGCITTGNYFTRMSTDVSTMGYTDVDLTFWWLCQGAATIHGEVYYSTNGGASWILIGTPITQYNNQGNWTQQTVTLPQFGNQATLRFGFRFVTAVVSTALDPGFGIDDVAIVAQSTTPNSISCTVTPTPICAGEAITVDYVAVGSYNPGNVFTAELSDALGSFASPVNIGSLVSTTSGSIAATIPPGTAAGTQYKVRVVGSNPVTTGAASAAFTVNEAPNAGLDTAVTLCKSTGLYVLFNFIPGTPQVGGTWTGPGGPFSGTLNSAIAPSGNYIYTVASTGSCPDASATVAVTMVDQANAGGGGAASICSNSSAVPLLTLLTGSPDATGYWLDPNGLVTNALFDPGVDAPGIYTYVVAAPTPCPNDTAELTISLVDAPDAGTSGTATICEDAGATDLFLFLGGTPDLGGSWTGPGGATSGIFIPGTSPQGLYTYTVPGQPPCGDATSTLAVILDPCSGVPEVDAMNVQWLGEDASGRHQFTGVTRPVLGMTVIDAMGRTAMASHEQRGDRLAVGLNGVPAGAYVIVLDLAGRRQTLSIVHSAAH